MVEHFESILIFILVYQNIDFCMNFPKAFAMLSFRKIFWTPGLPEGVLSNRPFPWSVGPSVGPSFKISETVHCFFLILDPGFTREGPM